MEQVEILNIHGHRILHGFMPSATTVAIRALIGSGGYSDIIPGTAHYLEHMAFKGTPGAVFGSRDCDEAVSFSADETAAKLAMLGHANAATSWHQTCYIIDTLPDTWDDGVDLLGALLFNPSKSPRLSTSMSRRLVAQRKKPNE